MTSVGTRARRSTRSRPAPTAAGPATKGTRRPPYSTYAVCQSLYAAGTAQLPLWSYDHAGAGASLTAGMLYTGTSYPATYQDSLFFGDYMRPQIWTFATDTSGHLTRVPETDGFATDAGGPVAFHSGPNGDVTYADIFSGNVRRLVYSAGNRAPSRASRPPPTPTRAR